MIDRDAFDLLVNGYFVPAILSATKDRSPRLFEKLLTAIRKLYRAIEPWSVKGSITVFARTESDSDGISGTSQMLSSFEELRSATSHHLCLEVKASGEIRRWNISEMPNIVILSTAAVVYSFEGGTEAFWAHRKQFDVPNVYPGTHSLFQLPAYRELEQALAKYRYPIVRRDQCEILSNIWFGRLTLILEGQT